MIQCCVFGWIQWRYEDSYLQDQYCMARGGGDIFLLFIISALSVAIFSTLVVWVKKVWVFSSDTKILEGLKNKIKSEAVVPSSFLTVSVATLQDKGRGGDKSTFTPKIVIFPPDVSEINKNRHFLYKVVKTDDFFLRILFPPSEKCLAPLLPPPPPKKKMMLVSLLNSLF